MAGSIVGLVHFAWVEQWETNRMAPLVGKANKLNIFNNVPQRQTIVDGFYRITGVCPFGMSLS